MEGFRRIRPPECGCQEKLAGKLAHTPDQRLRMGPLGELPPSSLTRRLQAPRLDCQQGPRRRKPRFRSPFSSMTK